MTLVRGLQALVPFAAFLVAATSSVFGQSRGGDPESAQEILAAMAQTYASCKSYQDEGRVIKTFFETDGTRTVEIKFKTAFVRPDRFRFQYTDQDQFKKERSYIIWRKAGDVKSWWDVMPGIKTNDSLALALARATGVSSSSAHTIPVLLLPDETMGRRLTDLLEPRRGADEAVAGEDCYQIIGYFDAQDRRIPLSIWISKSRRLVLKIEKTMAFPSFSTKTVTTYNPTINGVVPEESLMFNAPGE